MPLPDQSVVRGEVHSSEGSTLVPSNSASPQIPFRASKAKRYSEVTLHHPAPKPGAGAPYMKDLDSLPKGWTLAAFDTVDEEKAKPPKHGEALAEALQALVKEAQSVLDDLMSFSEVDSDAFGYLHHLDDAVRDVVEAASNLPDFEDEDDA